MGAENRTSAIVTANLGGRGKSERPNGVRCNPPEGSLNVSARDGAGLKEPALYGSSSLSLRIRVMMWWGIRLVESNVAGPTPEPPGILQPEEACFLQCGFIALARCGGEDLPPKDQTSAVEWPKH